MSNFANPEQDLYSRKLILPSGTADEPTLIWANDPTKGFYFDVATGLIKAVGFDGGGGGVTFPLLASDSAITAPPYSFTSDPTIGMSTTGDSGLNFNGSYIFIKVGAGSVEFDPGISTFTGSIRADGSDASAPAFTFNSDNQTGLFSTGGVLGIALSSVATLNFDPTGILPTTDDSYNLGSSSNRFKEIHTSGKFLGADNVSGGATYTFESEPTTGMELLAPGTLQFRVTGSAKLTLGTIAQVAAALEPQSDNNFNLGDGGARWKDTFTMTLTASTKITTPELDLNSTETTGAQLATLTNSPVAGNPTTYFKVKVNGVEYWVPGWAV